MFRYATIVEKNSPLRAPGISAYVELTLQPSILSLRGPFSSKIYGWLSDLLLTLNWFIQPSEAKALGYNFQTMIVRVKMKTSNHRILKTCWISQSRK